MKWQKKLVDGWKAKKDEWITRADELYNQPQPIKRSWRHDRDEHFLAFLGTVQPGEGWIYGLYPAAGHRSLRLSHQIHHGIGAVLCLGQMPSARDKLLPHLATFQATFARQFVGRLASADIMWDNIGIDVRKGRKDIIPRAVYEAGARSIFEFDPELQAVRLGVDPAAKEEPEIAWHPLILRSEIVPPADPAPTT